MLTWEGRRVLVIGLGVSGVSASRLLVERGAEVWAVDSGRSAGLEADASALRELGVHVELGCARIPAVDFALAIISPGVPLGLPLLAPLRARGIPIIGELELGYRESLCLCIGITGTDGKTTTTKLVEHMLLQGHRKTLAAGNVGTPITQVASQTRELDLLTLEVSSFQLESIEYFRPIIAVLTNIAADHLDRHGTMSAYIKAKARIFENQQPFDWAVVQYEALEKLRAEGVRIPSKLVTYSAKDGRADLTLDRSLLISRLPGWEGPLLDMEQLALKGPHNAENCLAALAVGRILRLSLDDMVRALKSFQPIPHRCEAVAEVGGVRYVNDSKATTIHALKAALDSIPCGSGGRPNVWLIAGGKDKGVEYHEVGPQLARSVKGAYLIGETRERLRASWSLFTPCSLSGSLLEAVREVSRHAQPGDVVLLSPACSSFDQFQNYQHRGEVFRNAVLALSGDSTRQANSDPSNVGNER